MPDNKLLEAALFYTRLGWNVIPLFPRGKKPAVTSWQKWQKEKVTESQVGAWWGKYPDANIGIITGAVSGIIALDVDGKDGERSLKQVAQGVPPTPISQTGKGYHYIFLHPGGVLHNFAGKMPGLDFRGDGGYIVAPPSIHPTGRAYQWALDPETTPPTDPPGWLMRLLKPAGDRRPKGDAVDPLKVLDGVPEGERDNTLFRYACRLRRQGMAKEEAILLVVQAAKNCHPPFPEASAREKVRSAWRYPDGAPKKVDPANIKNEPASVWRPEVINALAVMKKEEPAQYAALKAELRGSVNLNDLERVVNQQMAKNQKLRIVEKDEEPEQLANILPNLPFDELIKPYQWTINEQGIWQETEKYGAICACPVPVLITRRLKNIETGDEKVEISFYRDKKWRSVTAERSTVFSRSSIVQLANKSLPVSSETARDLVRYLGDLEAANLTTLPRVRSTSTMGWAGHNFIPGAQGDIVLDLEDGTSSIANGFTACGSMSEWRDLMKGVRQHVIPRFLLAASFAAPLLKLVGQRVFVVHTWGGTRGGKTAALKAALSVWGDPEVLIASFNATRVGLERLAAFYSDLPLGVDEKQVVGNKQGFVESLIYLLGLGKGKVRGAKAGGLQAMNFWRSLVLSTGEEPITNESSTGGITTRVLELYGRPIPDEKMAIGLHQGTQGHHGLAGPAFVRRVIESGLDYKADYDEIQEVLKLECPECLASHLMAVALVALADKLASQWVFDEPESVANGGAGVMAVKVLKMLDGAKQADDGARAYEYLMSWFEVHRAAFSDLMENRERYGMLDDLNIYIFPTIFDKAMNDGGFNPRRVLQDWADRDWIKTEQRGKEGTRRLKVRKYDPFSGRQVYVVAVKQDALDDGLIEISGEDVKLGTSLTSGAEV